jgi:hypothetical protein
MTKIFRLVIATYAVLLVATPTADGSQPPLASLDRGFHFLYNFDFVNAQQEFANWQKLNPDDPLGPLGEASADIFGEFDRLGVLEIQLLTKNSSYESKTSLSPDPAVRGKFEAALQRSEKMASAHLAINSRDRDALLAMTLASGLRADYQALVEKRNAASLRNANEARTWGQKLLTVDPTCYDAYLAMGSSNYVVGNLSAPLRWMLRLGGISGDKQEGIRELTLTAEHGHYLAPLARILLAIAYLRDHDTRRAQYLLSNLQHDFPGNSLFPRALAGLDSHRH